VTVVTRELDPALDLAIVEQAYAEAADYWTLADRTPPDAAKAASFFTESPPGCDPSRSHHLGLYVDDRLGGLAELSFGFPDPGDAYLGLMILAPRFRDQGYGCILLARVEELARAASAAKIYLAVLAENPRGLAFWQRQGFRATGLSGFDAETGHTLMRLAKPLS
jgi:ribosomal protein S18 acetylase RimI-like enzyme